MPNRKVRASATALPKSQPDAQADAELIALAKQALAVNVRLTAAISAYSAAEERMRTAPKPDAVLRTESDFRWRLFVGSKIGEPYDKEEIAALRIWRRKHSRTLTHEHDMAKWFRVSATPNS